MFIHMFKMKDYNGRFDLDAVEINYSYQAKEINYYSFRFYRVLIKINNLMIQPTMSYDFNYLIQSKIQPPAEYNNETQRKVYKITHKLFNIYLSIYLSLSKSVYISTYFRCSGLAAGNWLGQNYLQEEARRQLHKNDASNIEQGLAATPHKAPTIRPPTSHHVNYPS